MVLISKGMSEYGTLKILLMGVALELSLALTEEEVFSLVTAAKRVVNQLS